MNKRLEMLEQLVASGKADSFARYALGMELRKEGRVDDALAAFEALRVADPDYVAMYLMAGQMLIEAERTSDAKQWLEQGLVAAVKKGDAKARNEIEQALADCE